MFKTKLPPFENVVASQTAVLPRLPRGMMYAGITFELGGTFTQAQMSAIRLNVNGKTVVNIAGANLDTINGYDRLKDTATFLTYWFADPTVQDPTLSQLGCLDTSSGMGIEEFGIEVDIGAATSPTLKAFAYLLPPSPKGDKFAGFFKSVLKTVHAPGAAGQFNLPIALGSRAGGLIRRVHTFHANTTSLQVKRDGVNLQDDLTIAEIAYMNEQRWRTAQSGHCVWDPISQNWIEDLVPTLRSDGQAATFEFLDTVSAADTVTAYTELLAPLANI